MQYIPLEKYPILLPHRPYYPNDRHSMMTDHADASQAIACPLHAGDFVIHGPLTLHAAFVNQTDDIRRTWLLTSG
ncbi:MAG TPA: phytanoyl-CoA dioxygenase family protein [Nitrospira sp.]|nr:phytanoyl-CoA dioxygenase family protein [Nitrospira sp.]